MYTWINDKDEEWYFIWRILFWWVAEALHGKYNGL